VRSGSDRLAARVRDLARARLDVVPRPRRCARAWRRPAENFARNGGLVRRRIARGTGHDERLPVVRAGRRAHRLRHGAAAGRERRAGDALINILDEVAPLYPATRDWFLRTYGSTARSRLST
jgi:hypothetical protein